MGCEIVGRQTNELDIAFIELGLQFRKGAEFRCADGCEVRWVREENGPFVADPLMEIYVALGRFGFEVGGEGAEAEAWLFGLRCGCCKAAAEQE